MTRAIIVAALLLPGSLSAATQTGAVRTQISSGLTLAATRPLDFGSAISGTTAGTIVINDRTGVRTRSGGVTLAPTGSFGRAEFTVVGQSNINVTIALGPAPTLLRAGGTETMRVTALTRDGGPVQRLRGDGTITIGIGGTLAVGANQRDGAYAGTFTLTVEYQ